MNLCGIPRSLKFVSGAPGIIVHELSFMKNLIISLKTAGWSFPVVWWLHFVWLEKFYKSDLKKVNFLIFLSIPK